MKHALTLALSILMAVSLTACPDKDKGKKAATAPPPSDSAVERDGCRYDMNQRRYRYEDGTACNYDDYYNADACYNYYYNPYYKRYYNESGDPVECTSEYLHTTINYGNSTVIPYYNWYGGYQYYYGCPYGYYQVPVGGGYSVCVQSQGSYSGLNLDWWIWINL